MSEADRKQLEVGWAMLSVPTNGELSAFTLDIATAVGKCRIAVDKGAVRHFLVPVEGGEPLAPSAKQNLELVLRDLVFDSSVHSYLDLSCADPSLTRQFDEVILDVIEELRDSVTPQGDAVACIGRWRRLFRSSFGRMSPEQRVGLFAELTVFRAAVAAGDDASAAWEGPLGANHDFEFLSRCLEVKGVGTSARDVTIHGMDQLAPHDGRPLALLLAAVETIPDGETLDELVADIRAELAQPAAFSALVAAAGWVPGMYGDRYAVSSARIIAMRDGVPALTRARLITGALDSGIERVRYNLSLVALHEYGVATSVDDAVAELVG